MKLILIALVLIPLVCAAPQKQQQQQQQDQRPETRYQRAIEYINQSNPNEIPILKNDLQPLKVRQALKIRSLEVRENVIQLTVEMDQRYEAKNLAWGKTDPENQYLDASVDRAMVWTPDIDSTHPAEETQESGRARVRVSQDGKVVYRPVKLISIPSVNPGTIPGGVKVTLVLKSSSYKAQDLIFDEAEQDRLIDLNEYKSTGYAIENPQVNILNPRGGAAISQESRMEVSFNVRPQPVPTQQGDQQQSQQQSEQQRRQQEQQGQGK